MTTLMQNLQFGITDEIAVFGSARFAVSNVENRWTSFPITSTSSDSRLDLIELGAQWRFLDTPDWIATGRLSYQHLIDAANAVSAEVKVGFKNDDTIIYGFGRAFYTRWDGIGYGIGLTDAGVTTQFVLGDDQNVFYYDIGAGIFAALSTEWSVGGDLTYTDEDWRSKITLGASVAYQPWVSTALILQGRVNLWDNSDGVAAPMAIFGGGAPTQTGIARIDNYSDFSVGLQLLVSF
jgi:opacity protein-like surface antigen